MVGSAQLEVPNMNQKTISYQRLPDYDMKYTVNYQDFPLIQKGVKQHTRPRVHKSKEKGLLQISEYLAKKGFVGQDEFVQQSGYNRRKILQQSNLPTPPDMGMINKDNKL